MEKIIKNHQRLLELDVFRGFAAFYVFVFHFMADYADIVNPGTVNLPRYLTGIYGVQLFFIISGFVIFMTLEKSKHAMDFVVSRFARLYPGYWVAVLMVVVLVRLLNLTDQEVLLSTTAFNLTMFQHWVGIENIDGVYWTLSVELTFYLIMLVLFMTKQLKHIEYYGLLWLSLMAAYIYKGFPNFHFLDIENLLLYGNLFFAGILFYRIKSNGENWFRYSCLALCLFIQPFIKINIHHSLTIEPLLTSTIILIFFLLFYLFIKGKLSIITFKPLVFMGTISYSFYLVHHNISLIALNFLHAKHVNPYLIGLIGLAGGIIMASLITFIIEKPSMSLIKNTYKKFFLHHANK